MSDATNLIANDAKSIVQAHLDRLGEPKNIHLSEAYKQEKFTQILAELKKRDAVLVAHYYCDPEVQELAELSGGCVFAGSVLDGLTGSSFCNFPNGKGPVRSGYF